MGLQRVGHDWATELNWTDILVYVLELSCIQLFCDPMDWSRTGSSVYGIFQARILEWVAIYSFKRSSRCRDQTHTSCVSCIAGRFFAQWAIRKTKICITYGLVYTYIFPCSVNREGIKETTKSTSFCALKSTCFKYLKAHVFKYYSPINWNRFFSCF